MKSTHTRAGLALTIAVLAAGGACACTSEPGTRDTGAATTNDAGCDEETTARYTPVIRWHSERYPDLEVEDLYKLLHQSVAGPAHAIEDPEMARQWLEREWNGLDEPLDTEELYEPLSSDGRLVRVNLRPWRAAGHSPEMVLSAFVRTAGTLPPDTARIRIELDAISACSDRIADGLSPSAQTIRSFFDDQSRDGYPAIHHSEEYSQRYRPAYRVVLRSYLD
jgi:hypothetical protein